MVTPPAHTIFAENRKARFDYEIIEVFEAGIELFWEEVKSIRKGSINLKWSYVLTNWLTASLEQVHIWEYPGGMRRIDPKRVRRLLLSKKEVILLSKKVKNMGATIVPLEIYGKWNLIKASIALVKGRKKWEKKQVLKERDLDREIKNYL